MSALGWVYLTGVFAVIAYSSYVESDEPGMVVFLAVLWPVVIAIAVPVLAGQLARKVFHK